MSEDKVHNMASCMLSILDSLQLYDNDSLELGDETLSEMMFRKMEAYNIDLNEELGFTHLKPETFKTKENEWARERNKDSILLISVYYSDVCIKCIGFSLCLCTSYNNFIMSCNCIKPMTIIDLCLRDRDENGIERD